jgi:hypothetical protein
MKTSFYILLVAVLLLCTTGCEDGQENGNDKIVGTGPVVTKTLDLAAFSKIRHTGVANFYIDIGSPQSVVLKAQQDIIDVMTVEVTGETLEVGLEENVSFGEDSEEIRFDITMSSMTRIELIGVGDFVLSGPDQDALTINLIGVGNIHAFDMRVGSCTITFTGVGSCEVYVLNNLDVLITGVGNVYYKGNPEIGSSITGVGHLIDAN